MIYHPIRLASGVIIYLPTSLPTHLIKYLDKSRIRDNEFAAFKKRVGEISNV